MQPLTIVIIALAVSASAQPQIIHGIVIDPSARPIEGARVKCESQTVFSNSEGRFAIAASGCDAVIEKNGFETAARKLAIQQENRIAMTLQGPVETVVVSATRAQATPEEAAVSANVI